MTATNQASVSPSSDEYLATLKKAQRLEWLSIGSVVLIVTMVGLTAGQSQAMRAAWIEDALAAVPPIVFLSATRIARRKPVDAYPYGFYRSYGIAHLISGFTLFTLGLMLLYNSASSLLKAEKPPIGLTVLFGYPVWSGWLMIAAMVLSVIPPFFLGRAKMKLARTLHDKVLYFDADMNKADWKTGLGTVIGVLGIGLGFWWMDAAVAGFIALSVVKDGYVNVKGAVTDLMDARVTTFDDKVPELLDRLDQLVAQTPWVVESESRVRDQGHKFHRETFVVPVDGITPSLSELTALHDDIQHLDWKLDDVVVTPVPQLPQHLD